LSLRIGQRAKSRNGLGRSARMDTVSFCLCAFGDMARSFYHDLLVGSSQPGDAGQKQLDFCSLASYIYWHGEAHRRKRGETVATVQIIFDIEEELRNRFKAKAAIEGTTMKDVLTAFVENYVTEYKKGRRQSPPEAESSLQKLTRLEVLRDVKYGGRTLDWFEGKVPSPDPRRGEATAALLKMGLIERVPEYPRRSRPFRLTTRGEAFLGGVFARIGRGGGVKLDWDRANEIEFPAERIRD